MRTPKAVLISDVHVDNPTLEIASQALNLALRRAEELNVPLIIAGDLHNTKALLRGECVNRLLDLLDPAKRHVQVYVLIGNHDLLNEKSSQHSLHFLDGYVNLVANPMWFRDLDMVLIPYSNDAEKLRSFLTEVKPGSTIIMHQGVMGAAMGEYTIDRTSLPPEVFADFRVISGHYHKAQDIKCGRPRKGAVGLFTYIGTPYTVTFAEANDGPKGFRILYDDGIVELVPTNLRKHVIRECRWDEVLDSIPELNPGDLLWIKVSGPASELEKLNKKQIGNALLGHQNFKLDKIYDAAEQLEQSSKQLTDEQVFDNLIDASSESVSQKIQLKKLWREVVSETT